MVYPWLCHLSIELQSPQQSNDFSGMLLVYWCLIYLACGEDGTSISKIKPKREEKMKRKRGKLKANGLGRVWQKCNAQVFFLGVI